MTLRNTTDQEAAVLVRLAKEGVHPTDIHAAMHRELYGVQVHESAAFDATRVVERINDKEEAIVAAAGKGCDVYEVEAEDREGFVYSVVEREVK